MHAEHSCFANDHSDLNLMMTWMHGADIEPAQDNPDSKMVTNTCQPQKLWLVLRRLMIAPDGSPPYTHQSPY